MANPQSDFPNLHPCTLEELLEAFPQLVTYVVEFVDGGGVDAFTVYGDEGDTTPDVLIDKFENQTAPATYSAASHQLVSFEPVDTGGVITLRAFTDKGVGAGDNYTVKIDAGGAAGYLEAKIHADTWEPTSTFSSAFFTVLAAPISDAVKFYAPYAIIKNTAGDSAPDYHYAKHADHLAYSAADHVLVYNDDTGSTVRSFFLIEDFTSTLSLSLEGLRLKNMSGVARSIGEVSALTGDPVPDYDDVSLAWPVIESAAPVADEPFAIWLDDSATSGGTQTARARAAGVVAALIDITNEAHEFCRAIDGDYTKLRSTASASHGRILNKESIGTGDKRCMVLLGGSGGSIRVGRAATTITAATGWATADWGGGSVQFFNSDGTHDGDAVVVVNPHLSEFAEGASVNVDGTKVLGATCETLADA